MKDDDILGFSITLGVGIFLMCEGLDVINSIFSLGAGLTFFSFCYIFVSLLIGEDEQ